MHPQSRSSATNRVLGTLFVNRKGFDAYETLQVQSCGLRTIHIIPAKILIISQVGMYYNPK